ncbi:MAG: Sec-independent protein translocase protein TatB [Gammaproteobacteria bacterium]|nr:Sec-independent protein translocase protein TatB [Gammaproteobacteria bacterium]
MFDPSFFELIIICVVALLVLGPDRLPGAIKTMGLWIGRLRRSFNNIKREIEQEVGADEIRRQLRNEDIMAKFNKTKSQVTESIDSIKKETESIKDDLNLTKELSGITDEDEKNSGEVSAETPDPIEKLVTNDPTAKTDPPTAQPASTNKSTESDASEKSADSSNTETDSSAAKPEKK